MVETFYGEERLLEIELGIKCPDEVLFAPIWEHVVMLGNAGLLLIEALFEILLILLVPYPLEASELGFNLSMVLDVLFCSQID